MKKVQIEIPLFEKGDYVATRHGVGIVQEDELISNMKTRHHLCVLMIFVLIKDSETPRLCEAALIQPITKDEYNKFDQEAYNKSKQTV